MKGYIVFIKGNKEPRGNPRGICVRRGCCKAAKSTKPSSPQQAAEYSGTPNKLYVGTGFLSLNLLVFFPKN